MSFNPYYDWEGKPISRTTWGRLWTDERHIGDTEVAEGICVSTVWLGLDHNFFGEGPPLIFETMVFGGELDEMCWRYATEREARAGHAEAVRLVRIEEGIAR